MKTYLKQKLLWWLLFWTWIIISILWISLIYSYAWNSNISQVSSWSWLTAEIWNELVNNINKSIKQDNEILSVDNTNGRIGIWTNIPNTKLEVNWTVKMTNLQVTNSPFNCQKIWWTFTYKWNVTWYWANSCIKRATCPAGYLVTWCTNMDYPYYDSLDRIYNYLFPWFVDQSWVWITWEWCQWNNTFQNASTNNSFCDNVNFNVIAICCKMN